MCGVWVSVSVCAHEHAHTHVWHQCVASGYLIFSYPRSQGSMED